MRSWVIGWSYRINNFILQLTHWAPGYTPAHKDNPIDAIQFEIERREGLLKKTQQEIIDLKILRADCEAQEAKTENAEFLEKRFQTVN